MVAKPFKQLDKLIDTWTRVRPLLSLPTCPGRQSGASKAKLSPIQLETGAQARRFETRGGHFELPKAKLFLHSRSNSCQLKRTVEPAIKVKAPQCGQDGDLAKKPSWAGLVLGVAGPREVGRVGRDFSDTAFTKAVQFERLIWEDCRRQVGQKFALTGQPFMEVVNTRAPRVPLSGDLSDLIDDSLASDPDLRALDQSEREAHLRVILVDRRYGSTVSFSASAQRVDDPSPLR